MVKNDETWRFWSTNSDLARKWTVPFCGKPYGHGFGSKTNWERLVPKFVFSITFTWRMRCPFLYKPRSNLAMEHLLIFFLCTVYPQMIFPFQTLNLPVQWFTVPGLFVKGSSSTSFEQRLSLFTPAGATSAIWNMSIPSASCADRSDPGTFLGTGCICCEEMEFHVDLSPYEFCMPRWQPDDEHTSMVKFINRIILRFVVIHAGIGFKQTLICIN